MVRLAFFVLMAAQAFAADAFYLGKWKIVSAVVAPWWEDKVHAPDAKEMKLLVGSTVTFSAKEIVATRGACKGPRHVVKNYPADYVFQGAFGEMQRRDPSVEPVKVAAGVGFRGNSIRTLETGCAFEMDWHFVDDTTGMFGLNNYIYTIQKEGSR